MRHPPPTPTTYKKLAETFNRSVNTVRRFLSSAEKQGLVELTVDMGHLIITICNYNEIQSFKSHADTHNDTVNDIKSDMGSDTNRTNKTKIKKKKRAISSSTFEKEEESPLWKNSLSETLSPQKFKNFIEPLEYEYGQLLCPNQGIYNFCNTHLKNDIDTAFKEVGIDIPIISLSKTLKAT